MSAAGPRSLIFGSSGLVGRSLMRVLPGAVGAARTADPAVHALVDLTDAAAVARTLERVAPDQVFIASAWPWVDGCERDPARSHRENVQTVANVIAGLQGSKARVVYYSTDHVFDGQAPQYDEDAPVHPLSVYARHKRESEALLLMRGASLVIRTSYVFGEETRQKNFVYQVLKAIRAGTPLSLPAGQAGMPTWAQWLAESTVALLNAGLTGVVHLTGPDVLTKAEWARTIATGLALPAPHIVETDAAQSGQIAPRPDRVLLTSNRHTLQHPPLLEVLHTLRHPLLES